MAANGVSKLLCRMEISALLLFCLFAGEYYYYYYYYPCNPLYARYLQCFTTMFLSYTLLQLFCIYSLRYM
jgi:hypothetical protein